VTDMASANNPTVCTGVRLAGADIMMVKPAGAYLDIIRALRDNSTLPIAAYQARAPAPCALRPALCALRPAPCAWRARPCSCLPHGPKP